MLCSKLCQKGFNLIFFSYKIRYVWDVHNPNYPELELTPFCQNDYTNLIPKLLHKFDSKISTQT